MKWGRVKNVAPSLTWALAAMISAGLTAAWAQNAMPSSAPVDNDANSAAAMKETAQDPLAGQHPGRSWDMWDIGRPHPMKGKGAFEDHDPIGLAAGKLIPTDCSLFWSDPDTHQILCFGSQASLVYFLSAPKTNEERAQKRWRELRKIPTG